MRYPRPYEDTLPPLLHPLSSRHTRSFEVPNVIRRLLLAITGFTFLDVAFTTWTSIISIPVFGAMSILMSLLGLLAITAACVCHRDTILQRLEWAALLSAVGLIVIWSASSLYFSPAYGTDEIAFSQYAAQLVAHGVNPYGHDLLPAFDQFRVPYKFATYTMDGGISTGLAYPALSFIFITPLLLLGVTTQAAVIVNLAFLIITMVLGFWLFPARCRLLSVLLCIGIPVLFPFTLGGVNDIIYLPFLMVSAFAWDRYHTRVGWGALVGPAAFGAACAVKQLPWFIAPFLMIGLFLEAKVEGSVKEAARVCIRYMLIAAVTFLVLNLPFIFWNPRVWFQGILLPITQHAIPYGQGLVDLSIFFHIGGGHVDLYTDASLLLLVAMMVLYVAYYRSLRHATFFLPPLFLFFASRSLASYFTVLIMAAVVGAFTIKEYQGRAITWPRWMAPASFIPAGAVLLMALATPAPLTIHITSFRTNGQLGAVQQLQAVVQNHSGRTLTPHFAMNSSGQMTTFWHIVEGPSTLHAHQTAAYTLIAPNIDSMPPVMSSFQVQVVTPSPGTISSSEIIIPQEMAGFLTPSHVDHPMRLGQTVHFEVQLRNHYGADIHQAGVPVALGQVIYNQDSLIDAESTINAGNIGETPVAVLTDRNGIAHFRVTDTSFQSDPLYYEAWIAKPNSYPYGYSNMVIINWTPPPATPHYHRAPRRSLSSQAARLLSPATTSAHRLTPPTWRAMRGLR